MSTQIFLIYTATRAIVPGTTDREGNNVSLVIDANVNDPPMSRVDGTNQMSRKGLRKATTIHGRWLQGQINTPHITAAQRPYFREYFESTAEEEEHFLVHPDFPGWDTDVNNLRIYRPMNTGSLTRDELADEYRSSLQWRQLEV